MSEQGSFCSVGTLASTSGQVKIDLKKGTITIVSPSGKSVIGDLEAGEVVACTAEAQQVEPFHLGGVIFYGVLATSLRRAQAILTDADAGELTAVKAKGAVDSQGRTCLAGLGLGGEPPTVDQLIEAVAATIKPFNFKITDTADQIRQVIREELRPGGMLHRG